MAIEISTCELEGRTLHIADHFQENIAEQREVQHRQPTALTSMAFNFYYRSCWKQCHPQCSQAQNP